MNNEKATLSVVVPCYNEEKTLRSCVEQLMKISDETLALEIIIVDDCSADDSAKVAGDLAQEYSCVLVLSHEINHGKGAALRTGFAHASGDIVAVQDGDLEYDPQDLKRLLGPILSGRADVVIGSRFLASGTHRVLYFWHSVANKILTIMSNMLTDINLTDMECCYKVFRADVLKRIDIKEDRFGFEPEIVAKVARQRVRIYEMAISYYGRTYDEGKKITWKDAIRAVYCILHYNVPYSPPLMQFFFYLIVGGTAALVNLIMFMAIYTISDNVYLAAPLAFVAAAVVNYFLCIAFIFKRGAKWRSTAELVVYFSVVFAIALVDLFVTLQLIETGFSPTAAKVIATTVALIGNFLGRRYVVFPLARWA